MNKKDLLTEQLIKFEQSEKGLKDYMDLCITVTSVTRQGSGLVWDDVESCIKNAILDSELINRKPNLNDLIEIDVYLSYQGSRLLLVHNNAILAYPNSIKDAEDIISHPNSIFKLSTMNTDYNILKEELSDEFKKKHNLTKY